MGPGFVEQDLTHGSATQGPRDKYNLYDTTLIVNANSYCLWNQDSQYIEYCIVTFLLCTT